MDIRIIKKKVTYCAVCEEVRELRTLWDEEQSELVECGHQEERIPFKGVDGYLIKDNDDYRYSSNEICSKCMHTIMKGVTIINSQHLTGVSLSNEDTNK